MFSSVVSRLLVAAVLFAWSSAEAQTSLPTEYGQELEGYQDAFNASTRRLEWVPRGPAGDIYQQTGGVIKVRTGGGDPNHLLLDLGTYDPQVQEVLARIRILNHGVGDYVRGGLGLAVEGSSQGLNYHFRYWDAGNVPTTNLPANVYLPDGSPSNGQSVPVAGAGNHMEFLNDARAWGTQYAFAWQPNVYYWMRFRHEPNAGGGVADVWGKIWKDGTVEPVAWQASWDYTANQHRSGLAGITAPSLNAPMEFEVDYILIKSRGLPRTVVGAPDVIFTSIADGTFSHPADLPLDFRVSAPYEFQRVEVRVNGVDETARLSSTGTSTEKDFRLPLEVGKVYRVEITPHASPTLKGAKRVLTFDTLLPRTEVQLTSPRMTPQGFQFTYEPLPNRQHTVESRDRSYSGAWTPVLLSEEVDGVFTIVTDPQPGRARFYRILVE